MKGETTAREDVLRIDLPPEMYRGLEVKRLDIEVDESLVEDRLHDLVEQVSWVELVDEPIEKDDKLVLSYEGSVGSERIGPLEVRMRVGSDEFVPALEERLVGHAVGDEVDVRFSVSEPFLVKEWAGLTAEARVKIVSGSRSSEYELNDEYVASVSDFSTVEGLRDAIRQQFEMESAQESERLVMTQLAAAMSEGLKTLIDEDTLLGFALSGDHRTQTHQGDLDGDARRRLVDEAAFESAWRNIARIENLDVSSEIDRVMEAADPETWESEAGRDRAISRIHDELLCDAVMNLVRYHARIDTIGKANEDDHEL